MEEIKKIRQAVADYMQSEGCSCCEDYEAHKKHKEVLGELLNVPKYEDGLGYDFNKFCEKAKEEGIKNWEDAMVEVSDDGRYIYTLNFLSSFAEKIKEGRTNDLREYLQHEPRCNMSLKNNTFCDCGLDKLLSSNSQTIKE